MRRQSGIYKIQSKIKPERIYIGSAINITKRWSNHLCYLQKNTHHSSILQNHFNKYGIDDLIFTIIEPCFPEFLIIREQYYLDKLKPKFNVRFIAESHLGVKHSEETKRKLSIYHTGKTHTPETKLKISISLKGRKNPHKGYICSDETKKKRSEALKGNKNNLGRKATDEQKLKMKNWMLTHKISRPKPSNEQRKKMQENLVKHKIWEHNIGRTVSPETREKIRKTLAKTRALKQIQDQVKGKKLTSLPIICN